MADLFEQIDAKLNDPTYFEEGEAPPTQAAVDAMKALLLDMDIPEESVHTVEVSAFFGQLDVTWHTNEKLLRVITFSEGPDYQSPKLYFQVNDGEPLTRGEMKDATRESLQERLRWLAIVRDQ